jgi:hypothetical protein
LQTLLTVLLGFVFLVGLGLLFGGRRSPRNDRDGDAARKIGLITGLRGGKIEDAAAAAFAIRRLEEQTGKPASDYEIAVAASMQTNNRPGEK